jgi:hypothetical protein
MRFFEVAGDGGGNAEGRPARSLSLLPGTCTALGCHARRVVSSTFAAFADITRCATSVLPGSAGAFAMSHLLSSGSL